MSNPGIDLNIVITMAGRGSRFAEAGFVAPKYEIIAHGRSLLDWSLLSLQNFYRYGTTRLIFVCLASNDSEPFVHSRCKALGIQDFVIVNIESLTDGQATSAYLSHEFWEIDKPLMIFNIDTFVHPDALRPEDIRKGADGWVPCFKGIGDHWSFVRLGSDQWAEEIVEKMRISENASVGLYWFRTASLFLDAYRSSLQRSAENTQNERFIAPLYRYLILNHQKISISLIPTEQVHVLGTPMELNRFLAINPPTFDFSLD
jgi:hypothetical protein